MLFPARPRPTMTRRQPPMAVPVATAEPTPLGARLASTAQGWLARARTESARRIVLWLLVTLCVGALALAYLLQTSHVASLANERAVLEHETAKMRDANARLAAQAAGFQTLGRADTTARDQGLRVPLPANIAYLTLPDIADATPTSPTAPPTAPGIIQRIRNALTGQAGAENHGPAATPTPGAQP